MAKIVDVISLLPIGVIHSPLTDKTKSPIQSQAQNAQEYEGSIEIYPPYQEGLKDLEEFSHIYIIYYFHLAKMNELTIIPYMDTVSHGVFSTRAPSRPNKIGISIVRLLKIQNNILTFRGVDMLDNSPVLDLKPYIPEFDIPKEKMIQIGWLMGKINQMDEKVADDRFKV
jgi:tRNA-Thr(GGU) m(6)t(6)A37 methyltransferase TsaA